MSSVHFPSLQLLQQERAEQQRQRQRQQRQQREQQQGPSTDGASTAAVGPIDNTSFFHDLAPDLRRTILADVDDSIITHLPEEIATEARALRQERETRRRQILEQRHAVLERIFEQASNDPAASAYVAPPSWDPTGYRYAIVNLNPGQMVEGHHHHHMGRLSGLYHHHHHHHLITGQSLTQPLNKNEQSSKQMLDQEALTCLLVLLFFDQNKLHNNRLHRIVKNLSQHAPTRAWIISSLLAILHEASPIVPSVGISHTCPLPPPLTTQHVSSDSQTSSSGSAITTCTTPIHHFTTPHWLNLNISAALGSHTHVFHFQQAGKVGSNPQIHIHPLASSQVCNNVLDLLVFLSRQFPTSFLPAELMPNDKNTSGNAASTSAPISSSKEDSNRVISNFWHILLRLDGAASRKGKGSLKGFQFQDPVANCSAKELFSRAVIGQLMTLLQHSVIRESVNLTDKLLRVLSIASSPIPKTGLCRRATEMLSTGPGTSGNTATLGSTSQMPSSTGTEGRTRQSVSNDDVFVTEEEVVEPSLLQIVVAVLTSGLCSEDGLEDATQLLTNLSKCSVNTRENILIMLLDGIRTIGLTLCSQIAVIVEDLNENWDHVKLNRTSNFPEDHDLGVLDTSLPSTVIEVPVVSSSPSSSHGTNTVTTVPAPGSVGGATQSNVIAGVVLPTLTPDQPALVDHSKDLHLPSMTPLTCKGSQQSFFLRMLKVVCQLRESAQVLLGAQKNAGRYLYTVLICTCMLFVDINLTSHFVCVCFVCDTELASATQQPSRDPTARGNTDSRAAGTSSSTTPSIPGTAEGDGGEMEGDGGQAGAAGTSTTETPGPMEVGTSSEKPDELQSKDLLASRSFILDSLSIQLQLDELWRTLSKCLDMLAQTSDPHAVLILQPSVEAFFLVHATNTEENKLPKKSRGSSSSRGRLGQLSSFRVTSETGSNPTSPAPRMDVSPIPSTPGLTKGEESYSHLPPDTARFLMFAGTLYHFNVIYSELNLTCISLSPQRNIEQF